MLSFHPAGLTLMLLVLLSGLLPAYANTKAVAVKSSEVMLDAKPVATLQAGTQVTILGQDPNQNEVLVSYEGADGNTIMGLVPASSLIAVTGGAGAVAPPVAAHPPQPPPSHASTDVFDPLDLVQKVRNDREANRELQGRKIRVQGVLEKAVLEQVRNQPQQAVVLQFQTAPGIPKVKAYLSQNQLNSKEFHQQFNFGAQYIFDDTRKIEFRMRSNQLQARSVSEKQYSYTTSRGRTYGSSSRSESDWISIFPDNEIMAVEGTFTGFSMDAVIDPAVVVFRP